jgi:hypothetical protein
MNDAPQRTERDHPCEHPGCNKLAYRGYTTLGVAPEQFKLHWLCDEHWPSYQKSRIVDGTDEK